MHPLFQGNLFTVISLKPDKILTGQLNEIDKVIVKLNRNDENYVFTMAEDPDIIAQIYQEIDSTFSRNRGNPEQTSEPKFEIIFYYKDGKTDHVKSTEGGNIIYRNSIGARWIGGSNSDVYPLIESIKPE